MQFPVIIGLHRSRILAGMCALAAITAAAGLLMLPRSTGNLPLFWLLWGLATLAAIYGLRTNTAVIRLEKGGALSLQAAADGAWETVKLDDTLFVHPWLTVFRLHHAGGRRQYIVLTTDSLSAADFRHLRVFLRWQVPFNAPDDGA